LLHRVTPLLALSYDSRSGAMSAAGESWRRIPDASVGQSIKLCLGPPVSRRPFFIAPQNAQQSAGLAAVGSLERNET